MDISDGEMFLVYHIQGQPPPQGSESEKEGEQAEDKKQKENTAYAKKIVLRLAGIMGLGGAVSVVYLFGECDSSPSLEIVTA